MIPDLGYDWLVKLSFWETFGSRNGAGFGAIKCHRNSKNRPIDWFVYLNHPNNMQTFQHRFSDVQQYLHHRPPYLMVDRIVSIEPDEIVTENQFTGDESFVPGHFPGATIMPGAMMQEMSTQSAGILIAAEHNPMQQFDTTDPHFNEFALGVLVSVGYSRFKGFARPGDRLRATVQLNESVGNLFDFSAVIQVGQQTVMRNSFRLSNIESRLLQG